MKMPFKEKIKRFFGYGDLGLYRNIEKANKLNTAQISTEMSILNSMFKTSELSKEIENEKFEIKKDFEEFHKKFMNKEFHKSETKINEAERINTEFTIRIQNLHEKINDLYGIKEKITDLKNQKQNQENEFENEIRLHQIRFDTDFKKGRN